MSVSVAALALLMMTGILLPDAGFVDSPELIYESTVLTTSLGNWEAEPIEVWLSTQPLTEPFRVRVLAHEGPLTAANLLMLMEEGLYDSIGESLMSQWMADLVGEGFTVEAVEITYSEVSEIREYLADAYELGLVGVVLIGDLPVPLSVFEWEQTGPETFPSDYYFMDLDGIWEDNWIGYPSAMNPGSDGKFDGWSGELDPEIFAARIKTSNLQGDEVELIQQYLSRNHEWRENGDPEPITALCYVDDDWAVWGPQYQSAMQLLYPETELINRNDVTSGLDYRTNRLPGEYVWLSPYVHSSPTAHSFVPGPTVYWSDVASINPPAHFFNLFACSNCRFIVPNNMGGTYTFVNTNGLGAVGSCKAGSMLRFSYFYGPLGEGQCLGIGYRDWWDEIAQGGLTPDEIGWHLGMVLLGDPTLRPSMHLTGIDDEEGGGQEPQVPSLCAWPNPCSSELSVEWGGVSSSAEIQVWDLSGRLVTSGIFEEDGATLSVEGWQPGVYMVTGRLPGGCECSSALVTVVRN